MPIGNIRIIKTDGSDETRPFEITGGDGGLPELQSLIGDIEKVPHWDHIEGDPRQRCVVYVGSAAKGWGGDVQPENVAATDEWERIAKADGALSETARLRDHDYLAGTVLVLWGDAAFMRAL